MRSRCSRSSSSSLANPVSEHSRVAGVAEVAVATGPECFPTNQTYPPTGVSVLSYKNINTKLRFGSTKLKTTYQIPRNYEENIPSITFMGKKVYRREDLVRALEKNVSW